MSLISEVDELKSSFLEKTAAERSAQRRKMIRHRMRTVVSFALLLCVCGTLVIYVALMVPEAERHVVADLHVRRESEPSASTIEIPGDVIDPDDGLTVMQIVQRRGYAIEEHKVITQDRYVLTMYRMPKSYQESQANGSTTTSAPVSKPAVFLIHGLLDSSFTYVLNFRKQSLAYLLADAGFDVWLGNNRGTTWSRRHLDYTTDDVAFWDFSWENMAYYDVPAMLQYVLDVSNRSTLSYVGHSEGTMQGFAAFVLNQNLAKRVSYFGALAPVAFLGAVRSPVFGALAKTYLDRWAYWFGMKEFFPNTPIVQDLIGRYACAFVDKACDSIINAFTGPSKNINSSRIQVYISQTPAGTSVKNMGHFAQAIRHKTFRRYDYGCSCVRTLPLSLCPTLICKNKEIYGAFEPPSFELAKMKYPRVGFYTGMQDWLATPIDIARLRAGLPEGTVVSETRVNFNHLDFTWGFNAREHIYMELISQLQQYEGMGYDASEVQ